MKDKLLQLEELVKKYETLVAQNKGINYEKYKYYTAKNTALKEAIIILTGGKNENMDKRE